MIINLKEKKRTKTKPPRMINVTKEKKKWVIIIIRIIIGGTVSRDTNENGEI